MKQVKDKRKSNMIIAIGYCLLVIVLLINYFAKTSSNSNKISYREFAKAPNGMRPAIADKVSPDLEAQLKEQKRMNKEMREMIIGMQNASNGSVNGKNGREKLPEVTPVIDMNSMTLPELSDKIDSKFHLNATCPFELGRNPFAPIAAMFVDEKATEEEIPDFPGHAVVCNPRLPFVFTGVDSDLKVISNY